MNRGQILYRVAELMEGRRDQFVDEVAAAEGVRGGQGAGARRPVDRPLGLVRGLGRQDRPGPGHVEPGRARRTSTSPSPSRRVVGIVAPEPSSLLGLVSRLAPAARGGQRRGRARLRDAAAARHHARRGAGHLRRAGRRDQPAHRPAKRARAGPRRARGRRRLDVWGVPDDLRTEAETSAADNVKRIARRPRGVDGRDASTGSTTAPRERPEWIAAFLEMKTVWHPIGV